jgi:hypothetical protein
MLDGYGLEQISKIRIAEYRDAAARDRLAVTASQVNREARNGAASPLAGLLRALASVLGCSRPALETAIPAGHTR